MKAVRIHSFGGPDTLEYEDSPKPEPGAHEVLVRVHAAGVNPVDWKIREGYFGSGSFPAIMGIDFSGVVEAVGTQEDAFHIGDPVFGRVEAGESGSYAEFAIAGADQIARKPEAIDDLHAAAMPVAALTAWQALFDAGHLESGQRVLIHAAAGGVGSFAVQFAKWKGAYVFATASAANEDFVRSLGADQVIDYQSAHFDTLVHDVDLVLDSMGGETQERSWSVLKRGGMLVSIVQPPSQEKAAAHGVQAVFLSSKARGDELAQIANLVVSGRVKIFVDTILPLAEARQAQVLSQRGHSRGKIVLRVD